MKSILLVGLGSFGGHIAEKLNSLNHQVMAVDRREGRVDAILPFVTNAQIRRQHQPGFSLCHWVSGISISALWLSETIFRVRWKPTSLLKELGAKLVVSRAASDVHAKFLLKERSRRDHLIRRNSWQTGWRPLQCGSYFRLYRAGRRPCDLRGAGAR